MRYPNYLQTLRAFRAECETDPKLKKLRSLKNALSGLLIFSFVPTLTASKVELLIIPFVVLLADIVVNFAIHLKRQAIRRTYLNL